MTPTRSVVLLSLVAVALCSSCGPKEGNGVVVTRETLISKLFQKVDVDDGLSVNITRGQQKILFTTDENLVGRLVADVDGETLKLRLTHSGPNDIQPTYAHVEVSSDLLRGLDVRGGSQVTGEATQTEEFHLDVKGESTCKLTNVFSQRLYVNVTDKSQVEVSGQSGVVDIDCHDKSSANAESVTAGEAKVDISDKSTVNVRTSGTLKINSSGGSTVYVSGSPPSRDVNADKDSQIIFVTGQ